jgi:hypothetical protein
MLKLDGLQAIAHDTIDIWVRITTSYCDSGQIGDVSSLGER